MGYAGFEPAPSSIQKIHGKMLEIGVLVLCQLSYPAFQWELDSNQRPLFLQKITNFLRPVKLLNKRGQVIGKDILLLLCQLSYPPS